MAIFCWTLMCLLKLPGPFWVRWHSRNLITLRDMKELCIRPYSVLFARKKLSWFEKYWPRSCKNIKKYWNEYVTRSPSKLLPVNGTVIKITAGNFSHCDWPASLCVHDAQSLCSCTVYVFVGELYGAYAAQCKWQAPCNNCWQNSL